MIADDEDALICDFAETYHITNYKELPVETQAALAYGLRDDSRIKMKLAGMKRIPVSILGAQIADNLTAIRFALTAKEGDEPPSLIWDFMTGKVEEKKTAGFETVDDFEKERQRILMRVKKDG